MVLRMTVGLVLTVVAFAIAGRRLWWLKRLAGSGQPAPERVAAVRSHPGRDAAVEATEVIGQRKLLKWTVPGVAHALTFWGFTVLLLTIIESYGDLFSRTFAIPWIGHWAFIGFIEDLFAVAVLAGLITFAVIRLRSDPHQEGRSSRFFGSHTGAAWLVLGLIFLVIATLLVYRGAQINTGVFPYSHGAFASQLAGHALAPLGYGVNSVLEVTFVLAQVVVVLGFLAFLVYSKHLHIFLAPVNVLFSRRPDALGPAGADAVAAARCSISRRPTRIPRCSGWARSRISAGRACWTWPPAPSAGGASRSARPGPPASRCPPSRSSWTCATTRSPRRRTCWPPPIEDREKLPDAVKAEAGRPLVGTAEEGGVIDPDVLWSCTNCGACVEECPVDIEHIDHIDGMRRHQVLIESAFPVEAAGMLKNLENKGDPWGMGAARRGDWIGELDFEVPVADGKIGDDVEYLFWVGCAGALEDRAKKTTKAIASLLHTAGVTFAVLGPAETCTGDPARRIGNEFVFSMLAPRTSRR